MKKYFKYHNSLILLGLGCLLLFSCEGGTDDIHSPTPEPEKITPSNLTLDISIVGSDNTNPYGDGSGEILLSFSAENAKSYNISFGNGVVQQTTATSLTYTYVGAGTKTYKIEISAYNGDQSISTSKSVTIYVSPTLIFSEEFDYTGAPDTSKWTYDIGRGSGGWGNNESQYYTNLADNVVVENGVLKIIAKKEDYGGAAYTSARLKTQGKFNFTYGKVEVRAKLPEGGGTWPAIWLLGSNITTVGWPACGEIDIMEHVGNNPGRIISAIHTPSSYGNTQNKAEKSVPNATSEFHVYGLEWTSEKLKFSIDGNGYYTYSPAIKNADTWPFDSNQFIILNVAVGGTLGGNIDPNFSAGTMEVDYVRVYQ